MTIETIRLYGRIFLTMNIRTLSGLRIGSSATFAIGDIDNPVIRDPLTLRPYIPGSSLRGKMRSLWEKATGALQNQPIGFDVRIHSLQDNMHVDADPVCRIFGVTGDNAVPHPTRLIVHDTPLSDESASDLERAETSLYTETKWEAAIDRITSAAVPRQMERVPAGAVFQGCRLAYSIYGVHAPDTDGDEFDWFFHIIQMLQLVEDDYLGSSGSRGSGRVRFENLRVSTRHTGDYMQEIIVGEFSGVQELWENQPEVLAQLRSYYR